LGIGDWGLGPIPNPQSPIPNPQSPIPKMILKFLIPFIINLIDKEMRYFLKQQKKHLKKEYSNLKI
jgi:hypothetical protein